MILISIIESLSQVTYSLPIRPMTRRFDLNPDPFDDLDPHPLILALESRDFEAAALLLRQGAALDDLIDADGDSPLHRAAQKGDLESVAFYLQNSCPRTLESFDYIASTPLIRAARAGHDEIVGLLIKAGANVNAIDEPRIGNTAIREAVYGGHLKVIGTLLEAGADPTIPGWMQLSAIDEAYIDLRKGIVASKSLEIRKLFSKYPVPAWYNPNIKPRKQDRERRKSA